MSMLPEPDASDDATPQTMIHRFTVQRGMAVALVIETRDWHSGLLQAALARVRIEGLNRLRRAERGRARPAHDSLVHDCADHPRGPDYTGLIVIRPSGRRSRPLAGPERRGS